MKKILLLSLVIAGLAVISFGAVDVSGEWEMTSQSPRGEMIRTITIVQDGDKITVAMPSRQGDEITGEGTIKDNNIEWTINRSSGRGDFTMTYTGTVDGDTMSGEVAMGDRGSMEWTAKKL